MFFVYAFCLRLLTVSFLLFVIAAMKNICNIGAPDMSIVEHTETQQCLEQ